MSSDRVNAAGPALARPLHRQRHGERDAAIRAAMAQIPSPKGESDTMRQKGTRLVFDYWNELRDRRPAPARGEIAPAALGRSLANVFILDAGGQPASFRLAGTWLGSVFGRELTGEPFAALFDRDDRALIARLVAAVAAESAVAVLDLHATAEGGRASDLELVLLPLSDEPGRILGAIHAYRPAFWHGAYPLGPARLTGLRVMDADRPLFGMPGRPVIAMPQARLVERPQARRLLRVIEGNAQRDRRRAQDHDRRPHLRIVGAGRRSSDPV